MIVNSQRKIMFIWFPYWPLQRIGMAQPELQGKGVVLYAKQGRLGERVVVCSRKALQAGVRPGMPLREVQALQPASSPRSTLNPMSRDPASAWYAAPIDDQQDRTQLQSLAAWCRTFTPLVGLEPSGLQPPEGLVLDVTGSCHLWGTVQVLAQTIHAELAAAGYRCRMAVAPQLGAAWAMAHADPRSVQQPLIVLEPQALREALLPLPVTALRLPVDTLQILQELGLTQWKHLAPLPRPALQSRLGPLLLQRWDQAWGERAELWKVEEPMAEWEVHQQLEYPTHDRAVIRELLRKLIDELCQQLQQQRHGVLQLTCHLRGVDAAPCLLTLNFYAPTVQASHITELVLLQMEHAAQGPWDFLRLVATQTAPLPDRQLRFWNETTQQTASQQLAPLIDRLSTRLGQDRVLRVSLLADAQPEHAYRLKPHAANAATTTSAERTAHARNVHARNSRMATGRRSRTALPNGPVQRPMYLMHAPIPLTMELSSHGDLLQFSHQKQQQIVVRYWGPERIETGWWRRPMVRRDYYIVETSAGDRFWLFRCHQRGGMAQWFLHGLFG